MHLTRGEFVRSVLWVGGAIVAGGAAWPRSARAQASGKAKKDKGPRLPTEQVNEFVRVAHFDLNAVKLLRSEQPKLINASWDWGGCDWETALGAASHMGRADIANYLLANGARIDLFAAAMLGRLDMVKATLKAYPEALNVAGPHGIPLIAHAEKGGTAAEPVLAYLRTLGA